MSIAIYQSIAKVALVDCRTLKNWAQICVHIQASLDYKLQKPQKKNMFSGPQNFKG